MRKLLLLVTLFPALAFGQGLQRDNSFDTLTTQTIIGKPSDNLRIKLPGNFQLQNLTGTSYITVLGGSGDVYLGSNAAKLFLAGTDDSATTGNRTVNRQAGRNAFAASATAVTITNSTVSATSIVLAVLQTADATCTFIKSVVPAAGSFVVTVNAGCTGITKFGWIVINI